MTTPDGTPAPEIGTVARPEAAAAAGTDPADPEPAVVRRNAPSLGTLLKAGFLALVIAFAAYFIWKNRHEMGEAFTRAKIVPDIVALLVVLLGTWCGAPAWRELLAGLGSRLRLQDAQRIYLIGQLGKYIPGGLWTVVAQASMAKDLKVPRTRSATASLMVIVVGVVVACALGAACLAGGGRQVLGEYWWAALVVLPMLVLLHPAVLAWAGRLVGRVTRRPIEIERLPWRSMVKTVGWLLVAQILMGVQFYLVTTSFGGSHPDLILAVGLFSFGWAAGIVVPIAPAGAGVREAVLVLGLTPFMDNGSALLVVLLSRVLSTIADVVLAGTFALVGRPTQIPVGAHRREPGSS